VEEIIHATAREHGVEASDYATFRGRAAGRDMAAWLCRRWTGVSLEKFGVEGIGSVSNLVRRAEQRRKTSSEWSTRQSKIETSLGLKTQHKV
jgi:chromosomal replication initiation ATPase DnaA